MKTSDKLFFIALVPPEPVYSEVVEFKRHFSAEYNSKAALRSPPHITLHMPFKWQEGSEEDLKKSLDRLALLQDQFAVTLDNFGCFEPRVIYLTVNQSDELFTLQKEIIKMAALDWKIYPLPRSRPFHPHMTVAFRDLRKVAFHAAWQEYQSISYHAKFIAKSILLLKHNGKTWDIHYESPFREQI